MSGQARKEEDDNGVRAGDEGGEQRSMRYQQCWGTDWRAEAEYVVL